MGRAVAVDGHRPPRDPGAAVGFAVFVAWLLLAASGFWNLIVRPMQAQAAQASDPAQLATVEAWVRSQVRARPAGEMVLLDVGACGCVGKAAEALGLRLRIAGVPVRELARDAPRLPQRPEISVLDASGKLRYAGPAAPALFCTSSHTLAEAALAAGPRGFPALVLPSECSCENPTSATRDRRDPATA
jgi:hypothetical protein